MARLLRMPEVAANATEAVIEEWSVPEAAAFSAEDTLATVETDKAVVDVEAEAAGVLIKTLVPAGVRVDVGAPIAVLADPGEEVPDVDALLDELGVTASAPAVDPQQRMVPDDPEGGTANTGEDGVPGIPSPVDGDSAPPAGSAAADAGGRVFVSPLARRMAREAGLRIEEITGTGPRGRIVRRDVEALVAGGTGSDASPDPVAGTIAGPTPEAQPARLGEAAAAYTEIPHSRMRSAIASRLTQSKQSAPHFYLRGTARVDRLLAIRAELNDGTDVRISVNDLLVKAAARAHLQVPAMNVTWTPSALRSYASVDLSVAVATDKGLVTPVLRGVEAMPISEVAATTRDLVDRARSGRLRQEELEGGSFSLTNLGMFGTEEFAAILNPPQAGILAVGAATVQPVVEGDSLSTGTVMKVTLSVDHRAVDGAGAAEWMRAFLTLVEHPVRILA